MIFVQVLSFILKLIPVFLVLAIVWFILSDEDKNVFVMVKRNRPFLKWRIIPLVLAVVVFFGACFFVESAEETLYGKVTVGLNYLEASEGLNPNNTKFTASELTDDGVMEKIIEEGGYDVDAETLKKGFTVKPLRINNSVSKDKPYVATEYSVMFTAEGDLKGFEPSEVMEYYKTAFQEHFIETYSMKTNVLDLDFSDTETADYLDIYEILTTKAEEVEKYMLYLSHSAGTFVSSETGESFRTIYKKVSNYKTVSLENFKSYILQNGISKDRHRYAVKLTHQNVLLNKDYEKKYKTYRTYLDVIDMYERDMATAVLVPTRDRSGEFYMSRTKLGVDNFSKVAEDSADSAASYLASIETNKNIISVLSAHSDSESLNERAESMVESLTDGLNDYAELAKTAVDEYESERTDGYATVMDEEQSEIIIAGVKSAAKLSLVMLVVLAVLALVKPHVSTKARGREQTL